MNLQSNNPGTTDDLERVVNLFYFSILFPTEKTHYDETFNMIQCQSESKLQPTSSMSNLRKN